MHYDEILDTLQNLINYRPKQREIGAILDLRVSVIGQRASRKSNFSVNDIKKIGDYYGVDLLHNKLLQSVSTSIEPENCVNVLYRPDVYLSAGYGIEVYDEHAERICLDKRLFITDRGIKINPNNCEVVTVSGNSMAPEYKHGDRVILDKSITTFIDGHIFAFRYGGECFMKEINVIGKRVKCIPINKEYEPFFIEPDDDVTIWGRILPRIRL